MEITSCRFGKMVISGIDYRSDLIVFQKHVHPGWRRKQGHLLTVPDILPFLSQHGPDYLVVGTGMFGIMNIDPEVEARAGALLVSLTAAGTPAAVETYNRLVREGLRVMGAFHLTC